MRGRWERYEDDNLTLDIDRVKASKYSAEILNWYINASPCPVIYEWYQPMLSWPKFDPSANGNRLIRRCLTELHIQCRPTIVLFLLQVIEELLHDSRVCANALPMDGLKSLASRLGSIRDKHHEEWATSSYLVWCEKRVYDSLPNCIAALVGSSSQIK
jgi:hypothetical protein